MATCQLYLIRLDYLKVIFLLDHSISSTCWSSTPLSSFRRIVFFFIWSNQVSLYKPWGKDRCLSRGHSQYKVSRTPDRPLDRYIIRDRQTDMHIYIYRYILYIHGLTLPDCDHYLICLDCFCLYFIFPFLFFSYFNIISLIYFSIH